MGFLLESVEKHHNLAFVEDEKQTVSIKASK
jgi:hypothetical protein